MIGESIVASSSASNLVGGHGVLYGAVHEYSVSLLSQTGVTVSRCTEVVWGTSAAANQKPHNFC